MDSLPLSHLRSPESLELVVNLCITRLADLDTGVKKEMFMENTRIGGQIDEGSSEIKGQM